jgi:hypothetical protein
MPSVSPGVNFNPNDTRLLVVFCRNSEASIRWILGKYTHVHWERDGQIQFLIRPDNLRRFAAENSREIARFAPKKRAARVVMVGKVEHVDRFGELRDFRALNSFPDLGSFEEAIPAILRQSSLDWRTFIVRQLRAWHHSVINDAHVERWLRQFRKLGVPEIGERLLRMLDFWTPERLKTAVAIDSATIDRFDCICLKRNQAGKSGDFLGNLLRKQISVIDSRYPIKDFVEVLNESSSIVPKILFVEDCLLTGTEMTNFLAGLLGLKPKANRQWPVERLVSPQRLLDCELEFRFGVITSLGRQRLQAFLLENGFKTVSVTCSGDGFREVLTTEGQTALLDGAFFEPMISNCPANPDVHIDRLAFQGPWYREKIRLRTQEFCRQIGLQLFEHYLKEKGWEWPRQKVESASFGMYGLGLNIAFGHSVPKASLPLFWAKGTVRYDGSTLEWVPLFENAAL